jgi:hypothetical protein
MVKAGSAQRSGQLSAEAFAILMEEWKLCEAGIARFDTLSFQVRGWAISLVVALVAAAVTLRSPGIAWTGVMGALFFWWIEAMHKNYQSIYIGRVDAIQRVLRQHLERAVGEADIAGPMIARCFSGAWERPLWMNVVEALHTAFRVNVCATYLSLMAICSAFALIAAS